jgi:hypothetical protein
MPVLLEIATNRVISPGLFAGHGPAHRSGIFDMPCPYCRKKQGKKEVRRSNHISLLDETSMHRRGLRSECEEKWGDECDASFAMGAIKPGEVR